MRIKVWSLPQWCSHHSDLFTLFILQGLPISCFPTSGPPALHWGSLWCLWIQMGADFTSAKPISLHNTSPHPLHFLPHWLSSKALFKQNDMLLKFFLGFCKWSKQNLRMESYHLCSCDVKKTISKNRTCDEGGFRVTRWDETWQSIANSNVCGDLGMWYELKMLLGFECVCAPAYVRRRIFMGVCACVTRTDRWTDRNSQEMRVRYGRMQDGERRWKRAALRMWVKGQWDWQTI